MVNIGIRPKIQTQKIVNMLNPFRVPLHAGNHFSISFHLWLFTFNYFVVRKFQYNSLPTLKGANVDSHRWNLWERNVNPRPRDPERVEREINRVN